MYAPVNQGLQFLFRVELLRLGLGDRVGGQESKLDVPPN
jgi:hypothetical protein